MRKKGATAIDALIFLFAMIFVIIIVLYFFNMKPQGKTVDDTKELMGTNLFVIGLLKSQLNYEGNMISLSELVSYHNLKNDKKYSDLIRNQTNMLMNQMFGKDICWKMSGASWSIEDEIKTCEKLPKKQGISSTLRIAGFDSQSFDVKFETKT